MEIYYEKQKFAAKLFKFLSRLCLVVAILLAIYTALLYFNLINYYHSYFNYIAGGAIAALILTIFFLILEIRANKRKNIRFDGTIIKFCLGREVEHEFNVKNIDEMFNFRSTAKIPFGYSDSLAFRFHKNEVCESITSAYQTKKGTSSLNLIEDINSVYANLKLNRSIKEIDETQGVRFIYLSLAEAEQDDLLAVDKELKNFEKTITHYGNTYGAFESERVVVTSDSVYYNKKNLASTLHRDYIRIKRHDSANSEDYHHNDIIEFYNHHDELIKRFDTTLMINGLYFKLLICTIFEEKKDYMNPNEVEKNVEEATLAVENETTQSAIDENSKDEQRVKTDAHGIEEIDLENDNNEA